MKPTPKFGVPKTGAHKQAKITPIRFKTKIKMKVPKPKLPKV